jgi:hypothetical protein
MQGNEVTLSESVNYVKAYLNAGYPVLLRGAHGIGKSEIMYQVGKELGLRVVEQRVSQLTEGDVIGMPNAKGGKVGKYNTTRFNPPAWFATACHEAVLLFLDEVDRGSREVRQAIFQLNDSRRLGEYELHPGTRVVAATNGGHHGKNYQVYEMDFAETSRYQVVDVRPDFREWRAWAEKTGAVAPILVDFISMNVDKNFAPPPNPKAATWEVFPNPRQWVRLSNILGKANLLNQKTVLGQSTFFVNLVAGSVGYSAAADLLNFMKNKQTFNLRDAVKDPELLEKLMRDPKVSDVEKTEKVMEILEEILNCGQWLWDFDPNDVYTKGPRKGKIKAAYFMDALYLGMKNHEELCLPYIYDMVMGIQLQILEKIKADIPNDAEERRKKIEELQMRMKVVFSGNVDTNDGLNPATYVNKEEMLKVHYSYLSRICTFVREVVTKSEATIQEFIDKKTKEAEEKKAA